MMNRKEFYEYVKDNVKEYLPESYKDAEIKLQEVEKNNGLKLTGITIPNGDQRIVPTVYLDSCLLYTSPSPRDGLLSRMPSSA